MMLPSTIASAELQPVLQETLDEHFGRHRPIDRLDREPYTYRTSFPLEALTLRLEDETSLCLLLKDLDWQQLTESARAAKPAFLFNPLREIEVYRRALPKNPRGTAICFGASIDAARQRHWLFLERVMGRELYQIGEIEIWEEAARWLARFHQSMAAVEPSPTLPLINYDADFYRIWMQRALAYRRDSRQQPRLRYLAERHEQLVERLLGLPTTMLHGEFYASNVLVRDGALENRICPVDWEMAARGPGLIDLAALISGKWPDAERARMIAAYRAGLEETGAAMLERADFRSSLDLCRLHLAVQWLGWSPEWTPPPEHRHDWLDEASRLAEELLK